MLWLPDRPLRYSRVYYSYTRLMMIVMPLLVLLLVIIALAFQLLYTR